MARMKFSLKAMEFIRQQFEKSVVDHSIKICKEIDRCNRVYSIDGKHLVLVKFETIDFDDPVYPDYAGTEFYHSRDLIGEDDTAQSGSPFYRMMIYELTGNEIGWKFPTQKFLQAIEKLMNVKPDVQSRVFQGFKNMWPTSKEPGENIETVVGYMDRTNPDLHLRERYNAWPGRLFYFVMFEVTNPEGKVEHLVGKTCSPPNKYINSITKNYIKTGQFYVNLTQPHMDQLTQTLEQLCLQSKQEYVDDRECHWDCLKKHLKYFVLQKTFRESEDAYYYALDLRKQAEAGELDSIERCSYTKALYQSKPEEKLYKLVKKLYKNHGVEYQAYPKFLQIAPKAHFSYDIFIPSLKIAIEYQGKQHFQAVKFFDGEEGFIKQKERDRTKAELSKANGIKLVYFDYRDIIVPKVVVERVGVSPESA